MAFDPLSFIIGQQTAKGSGGGSSDTVLLKEQTINNFTPNEEFGGLYSAEIMPPPFRFEIGKKYNVVWDGEEWECAAQDVSTVVPGSVAIGDASSFGFEGNGEPFAIVTNETGLAFFAFDTKTSHTIKIYQKAESSDGDYSDVHFVTFMNEDGSTELYKRPVADGDDCADPVVRGLIDEPTKESTAQYNYTHVGWSASPSGALDSNILKAVKADKTVYANFAAVLRYYTINFYDGETLLKTESIAYGSSSSYVCEKENHVFNGWNPAPTNITGDMNCYGDWEESFAFADATWEYIAEKAQSGRANKYFSLGDTKTITVKWYDGTSFQTEVQIIGFNHDDLADGSGKAGITLATKQALDLYDLTNLNINYFNLDNGWKNNQMRTSLQNVVFNNLPSDMSQYIKSVTKTSINTRTDTTLVTSNDKLFIPSRSEYANNNTYKEGIQYEFYKTQENRKKHLQDKTLGTQVNSFTKHATRSRGSNSVFIAYILETGALETGSGFNENASIAFCI